jgi:glycogen operon protein
MTRPLARPGAALAAEPGSPEPLGATPGPAGTNFAVHAPAAGAIALALWSPGGAPLGEIELERGTHRTDHVWHAFVPGIRPGTQYAWRVTADALGQSLPPESRHLLLDPYAKGIAGSERWAERAAMRRPRRAVVCELSDYDWRGDHRPGTPLERTVLYELHVRAFTAHPSSGVQHPGTFAGLAEKATWLRRLGVTAVQLMPVAEFDETDNPRTNPLDGSPLLNAWGYAPLAFMAPRTAYAAAGNATGALREFRDMVRTFHTAGLEVILDVVFNHTGEGGPRAAPRSWRGLDPHGYFVLDDRGRDIDHTGCGHTFAAAKPMATRLILDALRFWAVDMHVDGFRFDLAATLTRGTRGEPLAHPALIESIATDLALAHCKLIAEPWDTSLYQVGRFPHHGRFAELNGRFRDDVRDWLRHHGHGPRALLDRLSGSHDLYPPPRTVGHSVNFLTSHDGWTLADLVSHERKHNLANGESNHDGTNDHRSWNGGAEGPTHDPEVRATRARQARNAATLLLLSRGALLWLWGDETLRSQGGNNNAWCHDGPAWWLDWQPAPHAQGFRRFVSGLLALRRDHPALASPPGEGRFELVGPSLLTPDGSRTSHRMVARLAGPAGEDLLLLVNGERTEAKFRLPDAPAGRAWHGIVDTAAPANADFTPPGESRPFADGAELALGSRALRLFAAR